MKLNLDGLAHSKTRTSFYYVFIRSYGMYSKCHMLLGQLSVFLVAQQILKPSKTKMSPS